MNRKKTGYGFFVAFGAGEPMCDEPIELWAGALDAFGAAFGAALALGAAVAAVFWSSGFFVAFGAGEPMCDEPIELWAGALDAFGAAFGAALAFGAGLAAMAGAVIRNAVARSDARVFFMQVTSFRSNGSLRQYKRNGAPTSSLCHVWSLANVRYLPLPTSAREITRRWICCVPS
jgi:hypothetical protein